MRKLFILFLTAIMSISLVACGGKDETKIEVNGDKISVSMHKDCILLSEEQMMSFARVVELTEDNWKDYISVDTSGKETIFDMNAEEIRPFVWLNDSDCKYNKLEFKDKNSGKTYSITIGLQFPKKQMLAVGELDLEFVSSESKMVLFDIPEALWRTDNNGMDSIYFGTKTTEGSVSTLYGGQVFKNRVVLLGNDTIENMLDSYLK